MSERNLRNEFWVKKKHNISLITHSLQLNVQILLNRNQIEFDNLQCFYFWLLRDMYVEASIFIFYFFCNLYIFLHLDNLIVICFVLTYVSSQLGG